MPSYRVLEQEEKKGLRLNKSLQYNWKVSWHFVCSQQKVHMLSENVPTKKKKANKDKSYPGFQTRQKASNRDYTLKYMNTRRRIEKFVIAFKGYSFKTLTFILISS